ncbi:MAG: serine hydrolase domain-containing protein [Pseudomonadota bacterium]
MKLNALETHFTGQRLSDIETYINQGMKYENIPGVSIALIEAGEVVYMNGFGRGDNKDNPISPLTPFQIASLTKSFSALVILLLEKDGKLSLDDKVVEHIPWFRTSNKSRSDQISIRQLLQHNSGFSTQSGNYTQNNQYRGPDATEHSVRRLLNCQLVSPPGNKFEYSNSNYQVVSHLIEVIEGTPFESVMAERIFQPLGMRNSFVQIPLTKTSIPALGFPQWFGISVERPFILGRMKMGDGGISASAEDLTKYLLEVSNGELGLVTQKMRHSLVSTDLNNSQYGLGWQVSDINGTALYEHGGNNGGFSSHFGFADANDQRADIGFVILTNYSSALHTEFIGNVRRTILGGKPHANRLNSTSLISLITLYGTILILLICIYRTVKTDKPNTIALRHFIFSSFLLATSYIAAYVIPALNGINLLSIYPFFPDLAVGLIGCSMLSLLLAVLLLLKMGEFWKAN